MTKAQQEPSNLTRLASICPELNMSNYTSDDVDDLNNWAIEVATAIDALADRPAQRTWVGLTPEEKQELVSDEIGRIRDYEDYADAIEAKLKEMNK